MANLSLRIVNNTRQYNGEANSYLFVISTCDLLDPNTAPPSHLF